MPGFLSITGEILDVTNALSLVRCSGDQPFPVCFGRLPNPVSFFGLSVGNPQQFGQMEVESITRVMASLRRVLTAV